MPGCATGDRLPPVTTSIYRPPNFVRTAAASEKKCRSSGGMVVGSPKLRSITLKFVYNAHVHMNS